MPHKVSAGWFTFIGFAVVACGTGFFSSHPSLFFWLFAPRDEFPEGLPTAWRGPDGGAAMRLMAGLQLAFGAVASVLLGLKLATADWWDLLQLPPEQLRQQWSASTVAA